MLLTQSLENTLTKLPLNPHRPESKAMLTRAQNALYWREWSAAKRALMPGRETWTKQEENERRHDITIQALGHDKSHADFSNDDFDKVLGALRAISKPGDLNAQLRQVRGAHRRACFVLDALMGKLRVDRNYVQGVVGSAVLSGRYRGGLGEFAEDSGRYRGSRRKFSGR